MIQEDMDFEILKDTIQKATGFDCTNYSKLFLKRRIASRMKLSGISSYKEYAELLDRKPDEKDMLKKALTVHLTHFFRDRSLWDMIRRDLLPDILQRKRIGQDIVIWSAGCSSGEEPITIAINVLESIGSIIKKKKIRILATDIDNDTIQQAKQGKYAKEQFTEMPKEYFSKYFVQNSDGTYSPCSDIYCMIEYRVEDILTTKVPPCDMIVCRNTVIYLGSETKRGLHLKFHKSLVEEGFLVLGTSEILHGEATELFQLYHNDERIYIKI